MNGFELNLLAESITNHDFSSGWLKVTYREQDFYYNYFIYCITIIYYCITYQKTLELFILGFIRMKVPKIKLCCNVVFVFYISVS